MANVNWSQLTAWTGTIDASNDLLAVWKAGNSTLYKATQNQVLNLSSQPLGLTDTQSPTNKTFNNTNTFTPKDGTGFTLQNASDNTKQLRFSLSGITTGTTRTLTPPNLSDTIVGTAAAQTLTNKTLTSPVITGGSLDNATVTVDSVAGHSVSNTGTIYGVSVTTGTIGSAALAAGSVTTAAIASGIQLPDKMKNPYKFFAYRNSAQNTGNAADAIVNFDTKVFDTGTNFDVTTNVGRFTAPISGFYFFNARISCASGTYLLVQFYKNGSAILGGAEIQSGAGSTAATATGLLQLAANDYIEVYSQANAAKALNVGSSTLTYFQGFLLSAT